MHPQIDRYTGAGGLLAALVLTGWLTGCHRQDTEPTSAQIESVAMAVAMSASQNAAPAAEQRLRAWAEQGRPVAQRELGLLYRARPQRRAEAIALFQQAAQAGDSEAAFQLGEMYRSAVPGIAALPAQAWAWYKIAAQRKHATAALMLALLARNGDGVPRDDAEAARWLKLASDLGNAHAMFLLSYAYNDGRGVPRDAVQGRQLLERAAEHEYPPAIQELALAMQTGDALSAKDPLRADHLLKEANEHRHNNWNQF